MRLAPALAAGLALAVAAPMAHAAPVVEGPFDLPADTKRLALGSDGNMWVTHPNNGDDLSRVTPGGTVTSFDITNNNDAGGIVGGPDGNLWVTVTNGVLRVPPGDPTSADPFTVGGIGGPGGITVGPDGNLWTVSGTNVIKIPTGDPQTGSEPFNGVITNHPNLTNGIVAGTDGRVWVADTGGNVVSMTTNGAFSPHPMPDVTGDNLPDGFPQDVAAGPGGQVLYTNATTTPNTVGRLFDDTIPVPTELPLTDPFGAVFANDGAYWIAQFNGKNLGRMMPDGSYTTFGDFSGGNHFPRNVAKGAGNDLWVILDNPGNPSKIARISGVEPPPAPGAGGAPATPAVPILGSDVARPSVSGVSMASSFGVGRRGTPISTITAVGTRIRFTLSEAAAVRLTFQRVLPGRRRGRRCVAPRRNNRRARRCTRYKRAGAVLRRTGIVGRNVVPFSGRIGRRALRPGPHRLVIDATDAAGNRAAPRTRRFRIVPRRRARR